MIQINRADKMNALTIEVLQEIGTEINSTHCKPDKEIRGVILTGVGEKAFAAGADIAEFADFRLRSFKRR